MNSKKKFIVAICSLGVVALGAIIALIAVIAAFNATTTGGFKITYSAKNVKATVAASYKVMPRTTDTPQDYSYTVIKSGEGDSATDLITFSDDDTDSEITKSFNSVGSIALDKDEYMYIHYVITNTDTDTTNGPAFNVIADTEITKSNMTVEYASSEGSTSWATSVDGLIPAAGVKPGESIDIYVRIGVETLTSGASFDGSFNFQLVIVE